MFDMSTVDEQKYLQGGIHKDGIKIVKIAAEPMKKDDPESTKVLKFYLEKDGYVTSPSILPYNEAWAAGDEDKLKKEWAAIMQAVRHILSSFVPEDKLNFKAKDWDEFCDKVVEVAGELYQGQEFQVVLLYKGKYLKFPKYTNPPFFLNVKSPAVVGVSTYDQSFLKPPQPEEDEALEDDAKDGDMPF